jgi:hypothetical protein
MLEWFYFNPDLLSIWSTFNPDIFMFFYLLF